MSKPFVVKVLVEDRIVMRTTDSGSQVVLDQAAVDSTIEITTNLFSKNIRMSTEPLPGGNEVKIGGGNIFLTTGNGNVSSVAAQIIENGQQVRQTMLTVTNTGTLDPADPVYNELNETDIGGLQESNRIQIAPDAAGTSIHSIVLHVGDPNIDGRPLWIQNIGTNVLQTLTLVNQSGLVTVGGKFNGPGDYVIPAGGGVAIVFAAPPGLNAWLVQGI